MQFDKLQTNSLWWNAMSPEIRSFFFYFYFQYFASACVTIYGLLNMLEAFKVWLPILYFYVLVYFKLDCSYQGIEYFSHHFLISFC